MGPNLTNESILIKEKQIIPDPSHHKLNESFQTNLFDQRLNLQHQTSIKNMHKNANNSVIIESNQSITQKKQITAFQVQATKVGNFVGVFATNSSMIRNNQNNLSVD